MTGLLWRAKRAALPPVVPPVTGPGTGEAAASLRPVPVASVAAAALFRPVVPAAELRVAASPARLPDGELGQRPCVLLTFRTRECCADQRAMDGTLFGF